MRRVLFTVVVVAATLAVVYRVPQIKSIVLGG